MLVEFFEVLAWLVLIFAVGVAVYSLVVWLLGARSMRRQHREEQERARRLRMSEHEEERRRYLRGLAVPAVMLLVGLASCDSQPTAPDPLTVASPSPSPSPTPDPRCEPRYCEISGDGVIFGIGAKQEHELRLLVLDAFRSPIDNKCDYARSYVWSHDGPIQPTSSRNGSAFRYYAVNTGTANVYVEVGARAACRFSITIEN